jgi:hypothetical protein
VTYSDIMLGRMTLIGAQRHLANRALRFDGQYLKVASKADRIAFVILGSALESLNAEFERKRCRQTGRRRAA